MDKHRVEDTENAPVGFGFELVLTRLRDAGLEESEAQVYAHLSMHGPARAAAIASQLDWPRSKAYRVLEAMQTRGLINASLDRPIAFSAVAPEQLFRRLEDAHQETLSLVKEARGTLLPLLDTWVHARDDHSRSIGGSFTVLKGRTAILRTIQDQIEGGSQEVLAHLPEAHSSHLPGGDGLLPILSNFKGDGLNVVHHSGLPIKRGSRHTLDETEVPSFFVFDRAWLLASVPPRGVATKASQHYVWTDSAGIVASYVDLFESLTKAGKKA